eukprot:jgi/Botrbrau1/1719/Bobra.116_2s0061.1
MVAYAKATSKAFLLDHTRNEDPDIEALPATSDVRSKVWDAAASTALPVNLALSPVRLRARPREDGGLVSHEHNQNPEASTDDQTSEFPEHSREWYAATALSRLRHVCKTHTASREGSSKDFIRELDKLEGKFIEDLAYDKAATMKELVERSRQFSRDVKHLLLAFVREAVAEDGVFENSLQSVAHTTFLSGMDALQATREDWHRDKARQMETAQTEALAAMREAHKMELRRALKAQAQGLGKQHAGELSLARTAALEEQRGSEQSYAQLKEQCNTLAIEVASLQQQNEMLKAQAAADSEAVGQATLLQKEVDDLRGRLELLTQHCQALSSRPALCSKCLQSGDLPMPLPGGTGLIKSGEPSSLAKPEASGSSPETASEPAASPTWGAQKRAGAAGKGKREPRRIPIWARTSAFGARRPSRTLQYQWAFGRRIRRVSGSMESASRRSQDRPPPEGLRNQRPDPSRGHPGQAPRNTLWARPVSGTPAAHPPIPRGTAPVHSVAPGWTGGVPAPHGGLPAMTLDGRVTDGPRGGAAAPALETRPRARAPSAIRTGLLVRPALRSSVDAFPAGPVPTIPGDLKAASGPKALHQTRQTVGTGAFEGIPGTGVAASHPSRPDELNLEGKESRGRVDPSAVSGNWVAPRSTSAYPAAGAQQRRESIRVLGSHADLLASLAALGL